MTVSKICIEQFNLRVYDEGVFRIQKVLQMLSDDEVWYQPNPASNSVGTLILHLCGNVTQWIGTGIGQRPDDRLRDIEFSGQVKYSKRELIDRLAKLRSITDTAFHSIQNDDDLLVKKTVQGFDETNLSILIHVIEHFSYHVGQIALIAKHLKDKDLGFYDGMDLNVIG